MDGATLLPPPSQRKVEGVKKPREWRLCGVSFLRGSEKLGLQSGAVAHKGNTNENTPNSPPGKTTAWTLLPDLLYNSTWFSVALRPSRMDCSSIKICSR